MSVLDTRAIARDGLLEHRRASGATAWINGFGSSMSPSIEPDSRLLVEFGRTPERIGEVVVFQGPSGPVAHRLIGRRRTVGGVMLVTKGDNAALPDPAIALEAVVGLVRAVQGQDGLPVPAVLSGRPAVLVAAVSSWSGRVAGLGRRIARRAPRPWRQRTIDIVFSLARIPTSVSVASIARLDRRRSAERR